MLVLILGIILLIGGFVISPHSLTAGRLRLPLRYAGLAFILIGLFTASLVESAEKVRSDWVTLWTLSHALRP